MRVQSKSKQRGITFFGLVFVGAVLAVTGVVGAQVFPTIVSTGMPLSSSVRSWASSAGFVPARRVAPKAAAMDIVTSAANSVRLYM